MIDFVVFLLLLSAIYGFVRAVRDLRTDGARPRSRQIR